MERGVANLYQRNIGNHQVSTCLTCILWKFLIMNVSCCRSNLHKRVLTVKKHFRVGKKMDVHATFLPKKRVLNNPQSCSQKPKQRRKNSRTSGPAPVSTPQPQDDISFNANVLSPLHSHDYDILDSQSSLVFSSQENMSSSLLLSPIKPAPTARCRVSLPPTRTQLAESIVKNLKEVLTSVDCMGTAPHVQGLWGPLTEALTRAEEFLHEVCVAQITCCE